VTADWERAARIAAERIERLPHAPALDGRSLIERVGPLWWLIEDEVFEARGGVADRALTGGADGDSRNVESSRPLARLHELVLRGLAARTAPPKREAGEGPRVVLVSPHGTMWTGGGDRHGAGLRAALARRGARVTEVSLATPVRGGGALADVGADLAAIRRGEYRPWSAGLPLAELASAWLAERRHAALAAGPAWEAALGSAEAAGWLARRLPRLLARAGARLAAARHLLAALRPDAVVSVEAHGPVGRALALAARGTRTRVIGLQGGLISPTRLINRGYHGATGAPSPDLTLLWGPHWVDVCARLGLDRESLAVGGFARDVPAAAAQPEEGTLLYAAGANDAVCRHVFDAAEERVVLAALREGLPARARLVVRLHPGHPARSYESELSGDPRVERVPAGARDVGADLGRACLVVAKASTLLVEAVLCGRPVVLASVRGGPDLSGLAEPLGAPLARSPEELAARVREGLGSPEVRARWLERQRAGLARVASPAGVSAVEAVAARVLEFAARGR